MLLRWRMFVAPKMGICVTCSIEAAFTSHTQHVVAHQLLAGQAPVVQVRLCLYEMSTVDALLPLRFPS